MKTKRYINHTFIFLVSILFSSCSGERPIDIDYSFKAASNVDQQIKDFDEVRFQPFDDLNLGFFRGNLWIKLSINNMKNESASYMFVSNDRFIKNYKFYKLDTLNNQFKLTSHIDDTTTEDYRTFNNPNPNLKIDLAPNESAVYLITSYSDGRTKNANFKILSTKDYSDFINQSTLWGIVFYGTIVFLILINSYLWNVYKQKIYLHYIFYLISTLFVYSGIEGYFSYLKISQLTSDHLVFIFVKMWALSLIIYTSKFLDIPIIAPKYYKFIKIVLATVIGGTLLYQFIFFHSSIQYLHFYENLLTILWILLILVMLLYSVKERRLALKYYLIPFGFFLLFTVLGIINVHLQILTFNSFTFVKIGAIFEFIGYTYFMTALIKRKLSQSEFLEQSLKEKEELLTSKASLVSIFKLIENSFSNESDWKIFKEKFEQLNPDFFSSLSAKHSDLSKSEIRLLTLIRIGYSQKEIATILNIAPDSVKKAKSRVRKKMNLGEKETLINHLKML